MSHEQQTSKDTPEAVLRAGGVICYPTEAVYGLGCDPDDHSAVQRILALKQRAEEKGLILIADNFAQLLPYVDESKIPMDKRAEIFSSWPAAITWALPVKSSTPKWLTGAHSTIAVRVSAHPVVKQLCQQFGKPLVSTSANIAGQQPEATLDKVKVVFNDQIDFYVEGALGGEIKPSQIKDAFTTQLIRE